MAKLYELSAYCDHRVSALQEGERQLQQRQSALTVDYLTRHVNSYLIKPGAGRVHRVACWEPGSVGRFVLMRWRHAVFQRFDPLCDAERTRGRGGAQRSAHASLLDADGDFAPQLSSTHRPVQRWHRHRSP